MEPPRHRVLLLKTRFRFGDRQSLFARARLYPDRIELSDWSPRGPVNRLIPLSDVERIEWPGKPHDATVFVLRAGERVPLKLAQVARWRRTLDDLIRWDPDSGHHALNLPLKDLIAYTSGMA